MTEALGVAFTLLNFIFFYTLKLYRETDDLLDEAKRSIIDEFYTWQKNFGTTVSDYNIEEKQLEDSVDRLKKIYICGHSDIHLLKNSSRELRLIIILAILGFIAAVVSLIFGLNIPGDSSFWNLRNRWIIGAPLSILIIELLILCRSLYSEKRIKKIKSKYKNREY